MADNEPTISMAGINAPPLYRLVEDGDKTVIVTADTNTPMWVINGKIGGSVEAMTTAERMAITPEEGQMIFDSTLGALFVGDGATPGGTAVGGGEDDVPGYRLDSDGEFLNFNPVSDIINVTGSTVTLEPDKAYKIVTTNGAVNITANPPAANKWGYDGHAEIFVGATGYAVFDTSKIVLANQLEPDSVNNLTLRFHDGMCYVSVEDHIAGYIVVSATGTTAGTLPYGITSATQEYIAFDATTNGTPIDLSGSTANGEKHIVGNGYSETTLTGAVNCGTSKFTVANLGLSNVQVTGGTMTLGDAYIPSGSTVAVSGGALAVEKVTGNGGVIDLGGERVNVYRQSATIQNVTLTNGKYDASPAAIYVQSSGSLVCNNATFTDNIGSGAAIVGTYRDDWSVVMSGCSIYSNTAKFGGGIEVDGSGTMNLVDCFVSGNTATNPTGNNTGDIFIATGATVIIDGGTIGNVCLTSAGNPTLMGNIALGAIYPRSDGVAASVTISSGAIIDLTGNTNATPIAPGGGIVIEDATILYGDSAGTPTSSAVIAGATVASLGNGGAVNFASGVYLAKTDVVLSGCSVGGMGDGSYRVTSGTTTSVINCDFAHTIYTQSGYGNGTALLGGVVVLAFGVGNAQASEPTTYPFVGSCVIQDNTTITTSAARAAAKSMKTLVVGANVTVNGNTVTPGTYTSATLNADGTITEA